MIEILVISMLLLSLEKITYMVIYNHPQVFKIICQTIFNNRLTPMTLLGYLLIIFKLIQGGVFINWWYVSGSLHLSNLQLLPFCFGFIIFCIGQFLNFSVFHAIGNVGVLYGKQFGYDVPWVTGFPFNILKHPQYVGTLMAIWGSFIAINFSSPYWYAIPALETILYILGAEQEHAR